MGYNVIHSPAHKMVGMKFGRLTVVSVLHDKKRQKVLCSCRCDCGNRTISEQYNLHKGASKSCGCWRREELARLRFKHGQHGTPREIMFRGAKARARKKGIQFDLSLEEVPEIPNTCPILGLFLLRGCGSFISESPTLDRINPELGYTKGNVRIISHRANRLKSNSNSDDMRNILSDLVDIETQEVDAYALS